MTKNKLYVLVTVLWTTGLLWIAANLFSGTSTPVGHLHFVCLFKYFTKLPCPSCGSTRSMVALLNGHIAEALLINPLGIVLFFIFIILPFWLLYDVISKGNSFQKFYDHAEAFFRKPHIALVLILLLLCNWGWSISKGL